MTKLNVQLTLTEAEIETCQSAATLGGATTIVARLGAALDDAAVARLYNSGHDEVQAYGVPEVPVEFTRAEFYTLIEELQRLSDRGDISFAETLAAPHTNTPAARYAATYRKLNRYATTTSAS